MFLDTAEISVAAGKGGDGCVSTRREKHVPRGGPDGGNGGRGGSVWFEATDQMTTLQDFRYRRSYQAGNGSAGSGRKCSGPDGEDVVVKVPCGTLVYEGSGDVLLGDMVEVGQMLCVAAGGRGGKGNWVFRTARNQTPMHAQPGREGQSRQVRLELKLLADIGLVGEPNAGKSTLLAALTAARPKIADYPFTTLVPNLGIIDLGDYQSCTLADIPGLISGASEGKGLGHDFLRHVERTRALILLIDAAEGRCVDTLEGLHRELCAYGNRLVDLPFAVVLSKFDLMPAEDHAVVLAAVKPWCDRHGAQRLLGISSATGAGLPDLRRLLLHLYSQGFS
ncbi:GTPase ObgE [bacterium CG_4_9_14_3_um_filter_65_15]|nr:MAG: GTPase ObgE [bacterium CG_4_9_14_3_um_filter_65_15]